MLTLLITLLLTITNDESPTLVQGEERSRG